MASVNPTARGRWRTVLEHAFPDSTLLPFRDVHLIGPFDNTGYVGLLTTYPPDQETDLAAVYPGRDGEVRWRRAPALEGLSAGPVDLSAWGPAEAWTVLYLYAEIEVDAPRRRTARPGMDVRRPGGCSSHNRPFTIPLQVALDSVPYTRRIPSTYYGGRRRRDSS